MSAARDQAPPETPLARILANTAWLLGGKGFGALCSIVYLVILTRTLGLKGFGHFALIFGTAQALVWIAGFQTWRVVVRFGAQHVHAKAWDKFGRLGMLAGMIDAIGAIVGCAMAAAVFYGAAQWLDLNPRYVDMGFAFSCAALWSIASAPTGIVRAQNRFDVSVYVEAMVPLCRLLAAVAIWLTGPSVGRFLFAWAVIDLLEVALYWFAAHRLRPEAVRLSYLGQWRQTLVENPGVIRFFLATYASTTLDGLVRHGPLLAVGAVIGTRAAGIYRLASQLAQALSKFSTTLTRTVYTEVARTRVTHEVTEFRRLAFQTSKIAGISGAVVVLIAVFAGRPIIELIGGEAFKGGAVVMIPLAIAASFDLASVAFEPVLHATGRAGRALAARLAGVVALALGIALFYQDGAIGIAWAVTIGAAVIYVVMGLLALWTLRQLERHEVELESVDEANESSLPAPLA